MQRSLSTLIGILALGVQGSVMFPQLTSAAEMQLQWQAKGISGKAGYYQPARLELSDKQPESVMKLPDGVEKLKFGTLNFGASEAPLKCVVSLFEPKRGEGKLWIDANANGDLTDDPAVEWKPRTNKRGTQELIQFNGSASIEIPYDDEKRTLNLSLYRFDPEDPSRAAFKNVVFYYRDSGYSGKVQVGDKEYPALLVDDASRGDFRGINDPKDSKVSLLLDVNGSGTFELRNERFDVRQPFNLSGTTYEITGLTPVGGKFEIIKSSKTVVEKPVAAVIAKGKKPPTFEAKTITGKTVRFPQDYEGRLVMVDIWATWCGPCREEVPNLRSVYEEFHSEGFDVLGISIDDPDNREKLDKYLKDNDISWQQVNEDEGFDGRLASTFGVTGIPFCVLVDGKSGLIVATSASLRGPNLRDTIERRLERLGEPPSEDPTPEHGSRAEDPLLAKAKEAAQKDGFPNGIKFSELRRNPTATPLMLPAPNTQPLRGRDIAQRAADAHVRCGWVFHCSKCNRWHLQVAGGYAIANDAVATAAHVMAEPSASKREDAFPIVIIGEDRIVPVTSVVALDTPMDTIVLTVGVTDLKPIALSEDVRIGDAVFCFSDPQGIRGYFSAGLVNRQFSLKSGSQEPRHQRLHVSADWGKGSSGSAVLDEHGNAIGHVLRIQPIFLSNERAASTARSATVFSLHEAAPAKSVRSLIKSK